MSTFEPAVQDLIVRKIVKFLQNCSDILVSLRVLSNCKYKNDFGILDVNVWNYAIYLYYVLLCQFQTQ